MQGEDFFEQSRDVISKSIRKVFPEATDEQISEVICGLLDYRYIEDHYCPNLDTVAVCFPLYKTRR